MNSKLLSEKALTIIDQYLHFKMGAATVSIPYYNNNHKKIRAALRATTGKGSPKDIFDEVEISLMKNGSRAAASSAPTGAVHGGAFRPGIITSDSLKHFLVNEDIGIDCSGFAYYVLNAESVARGKSSLDRHLKFPLCKGIIGKIRCKMRPAENAGVRTFAHEKNSHPITLTDIAPGDIITMLGDHDHIILVSQVEYQNFIPTTIHYVHSIAWPSDGEYGHGVRTGTITISNINAPITSQIWEENEKTGTENYTLQRAISSSTEIRRLNWF